MASPRMCPALERSLVELTTLLTRFGYFSNIILFYVCSVLLKASTHPSKLKNLMSLKWPFPLSDTEWPRATAWQGRATLWSKVWPHPCISKYVQPLANRWVKIHLYHIPGVALVSLFSVHFSQKNLLSYWSCRFTNFDVSFEKAFYSRKYSFFALNVLHVLDSISKGRRISKKAWRKNLPL